MAQAGKLALTPEVEAVVCETYANTGSLWLAAEAAGVTRRTIYNWTRAAEQAGPGSAQAGFVVALRKARAARLVTLYKQADAWSSKDFRAVQFQIERLEASIEKHGDPSAEAWANLTEDEVVDEVAKDPRVIAAVEKQRAEAPKALPSTTKPKRGKNT